MRLRIILMTIFLLLIVVVMFLYIKYQNQKENMHEIATHIVAPRSSTWNYLIDTSKYKNWMTDFHDSTLKTGRLGRLGSTYTMRYIEPDGKQFDCYQKITKIKPYESIGYTFSSPAMESTIEYSLEDISLQETYISFKRKYEISGFLHYLTYITKPSELEEQDSTQLNLLKIAIESSHDPNSGAINKKKIPAVRISN